MPRIQFAPKPIQQARFFNREVRQRNISTIRRPALAVTFALAAMGTAPVPAQTYSVLHSFTDTADGAYPQGGVIRDSAGNLYGTANEAGAHGYGVVFRLSPAGSLTVLHNFAGPPGDGGGPTAGVIRDSAGNLYGTTAYGGIYNSDCIDTSACGVVFKLDPAGNETVLYNFTGGTDGAFPNGVVRDSSGNLYGATGGVGSDPDNGGIFELDPAGTLTVLHSFAGPPADGRDPNAAPIRDAAGNLYGTTSVGGALKNLYCPYQCGIVFKLDPAGQETILHNSAGYPSDGESPWPGVIGDAAGNLYGTTQVGGASNQGVVFKLDPSGNVTLLHSFAGPPHDGTDPLGGVTRDAAGNLYGTTNLGGIVSRACTNLGCGIVYKLDPAGNLTVLHRFSGSDGRNPYAGVTLDSAGNLYGTTFYGGAYDLGVVFKITP